MLDDDYTENADIYGETLNTNLELKKFNWGAFFFTFIWGIGNGFVAMKHTLPIVYINSAAIFFYVFFGALFGIGYTITYWGIILAFMIYCGINGNQWAYESARCMDLRDFTKLQTRWGYAAAIGALVVAALVLPNMFHSQT